MPTVYSPPVNTYIPLAEITLAATTTEVVFAGISQDYRDLVIETTTSGATGGLLQIQLNGDTGSNYTQVVMYGSGASALSFSYSTIQGYLTISAYTNTSSCQATLMDYSASDKHTTILSRADYANAIRVQASAIRWANTSPVSSIRIYLGDGSFAVGDTFTLHGIEA